MPVYTYKCQSCNLHIDLPEIGLEGSPCELYIKNIPCKGTLKRVYNFGGTVLKGSGWYSVDKRRTDGGTIGIDP